MPHHSLSIRSLKFKCSRFCGKSPSLWWYLLRISQYTIIWLATSFSLDERLLACVRARLLCLFIRLIVIYVSVCCSHFCESITLHIVNFHDSFEPRASEFRIMFMLLSVVRPLFSFWWSARVIQRVSKSQSKIVLLRRIRQRQRSYSNCWVKFLWLFFLIV